MRPKKKQKTARRPPPLPRPTSIVGIGASAGGLEAFEQLLPALPPDTGMGFVLIQHLAPQHESILPELLRKSTKMPVSEVREGIRVEPNHIYVIPPNKGMSILDGVLHLSSLGVDRVRRMPIDVFLRSLAEDQQSRAIGIILSGTASDGTLGLQAVKAVGGITFAQDDGSAKYNAMPRSATAAGNVDFVLPPHLIGRELQRIATHVHVLASEDHAEAQEKGASEEALTKILHLLRKVSRVDFSHYKPGTVKRRITRRMFLRKVDDLEGYLKYLRENPEEVEALFNDVLINVTGFFRDPEAFDALRKHVLPKLLKDRNSGRPVRIWVPGCATGEEPYSLAMVLLEYLGGAREDTQIQIFATDVSEGIIQRARAGIYPESIAMDMPPERLRRYFHKVDGGYQISKAVRDICLFAKQDVAKDPPFSKLDMISCRNVMIYMEPILQKRIVPMFHYALNRGGILFLGTSETIGTFDSLFAPIDKKSKIYLKKDSIAPFVFESVSHLHSDEEPKKEYEPPAQSKDLQKIADEILLTRYVPPSVMVNDRLDVVQFIGQIGPFLDPAPGNATLNLLKLVKSDLHAELRQAFQGLKETGTFRKEGLLIEHNGGLKTVNFEIMPVRNAPGNQRYHLVVFEEGNHLETSNSESKRRARPIKKPAKAKMSKADTDYAHLKEELDATREYLQSIIEEQRTTNEELRSANEEIQSSNEELQSINEELETAKEELQSTNEELTTVNEELQNRNEELTILSSDLKNLLGSINIPIIMLGNDLRLRRFTPVAEKIMNLIPSDIGRPFADIKSNLKIENLPQVIGRVMDSLEIQEIEVQATSGKWYAMTIRPYRTVDNKIDGVIIILLDLDLRLHPKKS